MCDKFNERKVCFCLQHNHMYRRVICEEEKYACTIKSLEVTIMKKSRKIMMVLCVVALLVSVLAIPASAATNDHYHTFSWEGSQRYASVTTVWRKANNSPTYFRVENDSMPLDGFYIQTTLAHYGGTQAATSSYFLTPLMVARR